MGETLSTTPPHIVRLGAAESEVESDDLHRAREQSWSEHYDEALALYKKILTEYPEKTDVRREFARVLGWAGRYGPAVAQYGEASAQDPDDQALEAEWLAKTAFYSGRDRIAERQFRRWLLIEPDSIEARSGLADVLSRVGRKSEALELYRRLRAELKDQPWVAMKTRKLDRETGSWFVRAGFRSREADSGSRQTEHRERGGFVTLDRAVSDTWSIRLDQENSKHFFVPIPTIDRSVTGVGTVYAEPGAFAVAGRYARSVYSWEAPDSDLWEARLAVKAWDGITPSFEYQRDDLIENSVTLRNGLRRDLYRLKAEVRPLRQAFVNARIEKWQITDGNDRDSAFIESIWRAVEGPRQLDFFYRYETYGYDAATSDYFSPDNFHSNESGFRWRRQLGSAARGDDPEDHYLFEYAAGFDVHRQIGHRLSWAGRFGIGSGWALEAEYYAKIYEHENIYAENGLSITVNHAIGS